MSNPNQCENHPTDDEAFNRAVLRAIFAVRQGPNITIYIAGNEHPSERAFLRSLTVDLLNDGEAESFGDCERQTFGVCRDVEVEKEGAVTLGPKESNEGIVERRREIGGNWGEVRF